MKTFRRLATLATLTTIQGSALAGTLIVQVSPTTTAEAIATASSFPLIEKAGPFALYEFPSFLTQDAAQSAMQSIAGVIWAEHDAPVSIPPQHSKGSSVARVFDPALQFAENSGAMAQIHWSPISSIRGANPNKIAILDTGLSPYIPSLWKGVVAAGAFEPYTRHPYDMPRRIDPSGNGIPDEGVGHGTAVTSMIRAVAPDARLIIAKVANSDGLADSWSITKGLVFAVSNGARVVNMSLGAIEAIPALSDVVDWLETKNVLLCSPAGNNNQDHVFFPARINKVLCTAGLDPQDHKAPFSNFGHDVRTSAPATGIVVADWTGAMIRVSGTSIASPMLAAAIVGTPVSLSGVSNDQIRNAIENSGDDLDQLNPSFSGELGTGLNVGALRTRLANLAAGNARR